MSEPAAGGIVLRDFPGIVNNLDPRDLPPGTAEQQVNLLSRIQGQMIVRRGLREVTFDSTVG